MKKTLVATILLLCVLSTSFAATAQGVYQRKSITAMDSVWVFPQAQYLVNRTWAFDLDRFADFLSFYIEMPRFDFNTLPDTLKESFTRRANNMFDISVNTLSHLLETTVVDEIMSILNDPEIQRARVDNFKDEASLQSFAATKAKSLGLTEEELLDLFNSAYIYLPFISSAYVVRNDEGIDTVHIEGGIIWWKIDVDISGVTSIREIATSTTWAMGFIDYDRSDHIFSFDDHFWYTGPLEYAVNDAMLAFAKNLSVKTREIDDFKLQAQIVERDGRTYGFPLGRNEGVHLDDGYHIMGYREDASGAVVSFKKGYLRVTETGDNDWDPADLSYGVQLIGNRADVGDVLMENPRLGIDFGLFGGRLSGSDIRAEHTQVTIGTDDYQAISETASSQLMFNAMLSYNLAPVVEVPQLFITFETAVGFPAADRVEGASLSVVSPYVGLSKGFGRRLYTKASVSVGFDLLNISYQAVDRDVAIEHRAIGVKGMLELGYLISPNWRLSLFGSHKIGFSPYSTSATVDGIPWSREDSRDLRMGGTTIGIGFTYALGALPFNLFGFLDVMRNY